MGLITKGKCKFLMKFDQYHLKYTILIKKYYTFSKTKRTTAQHKIDAMSRHNTRSQLNLKSKYIH